MKRKLDTYFYQSQRAWIEDDCPLKILVKSRQTGFSWSNSFRLVRLASARGARLAAPPRSTLYAPRRLSRVLLVDPASFQHVIRDHRLVGWRYTGNANAPIESQVF